MATIRLNFLYPHLFRAARLAESAVQPTKTRYRSRSCRPRQPSRTLTTSTLSRQAVFERHGHAVEPQQVDSDSAKLPRPEKSPAQLPKPPPGEAKETTAPSEKSSSKKADEPRETDFPSSDATSDPPPSSPAPDGASSENQSKASADPQQASDAEKIEQSGPMGVVLHMPPPGASGHHHPHISKPTYVHHFDTYTLVRQLEAGGYTREQAITVMKAVRAILAQNLDVAQDGLVGKSDVDNETYLFRAACSELSSEVTNSRRAADEQTRQQRTHLQHEVDILTQRMSQDIMTLRDDVKGMFNDRRMNVRDEQRHMESAIQQVNLKISVTLNSDSRSEIEGLRWVLIRRSVLGILFMATMTLLTLRYATYVTHERQKEAARKAREAEEMKRNGGREDRAPPVDAAEILAAN
ncbi:hypothetical protein GGS20DRAFT_580901 [Poronia punctata]|nr:hypothetical protein GGS20DRAFT_580901 [Poronia punctata]